MPFIRLQGAPKGPQRFQMIPNGWPSVPLSVEIKCFTIGRFHYGKTGCYSIGKVDNGISDVCRYVSAVLRLWVAPKDPWGSPMVLNGQPSGPWESQIKYFTMGWFHHGKNGWKMDKEIYNDLRHILAVSHSEVPPKHRLGSPMAPNGQASMQWEVEIKYFTMGLFHYGKTGCYLPKRWTTEILINWCMFWPFLGSEGPQGTPRVPNGS